MRPLITGTLAAILALAFALPAPAHASTIRWPWEKPSEGEERDREWEKRDDDRAPEQDRTRDPRPGGRRVPPRDTQGYRGPADAHDAFLVRMLDNAREQLALAEAVLARTQDHEVRAFARRTMDEVGAFERTLEQEARARGLDVRSRGGRVSLPSSGWAMDLAYLTATMDVIGRDRPYFADYKSSVGGGYHDVLQRHWDDMVDRRDDAKRLHDAVRNDARRHGGNV